MSNVLIVTGGSRGIGAETAKLAAGRGYAVCVNYRRNQAAAAAVVGAIKAATKYDPSSQVVKNPCLGCACDGLVTAESGRSADLC